MGVRNRQGQYTGNTLSKVLRISYELPKSKDDFISIEKEEGHINELAQFHQQEEEDSSDIFPQARQMPKSFNNDSSMTKDGDRTEVQDFTKPIELQGGIAYHKPQSDS